MTTQLITISPTDIISQVEGPISSELDGEAVVLNLDSGVYYGLNEVSARIWQLTREPISFEKIHTTLLEEYDVEGEACKQDLTQVLTDLKGANLIEIKHRGV